MDTLKTKLGTNQEENLGIFFEMINLAFSDISDPTNSLTLHGIPFYEREIWTHPQQGCLLKQNLEDKLKWMYHQCDAIQRKRLDQCYQSCVSYMKNVIGPVEWEPELLNLFINYLITLGEKVFLSISPGDHLRKKYYVNGIPREIKFPFKPEKNILPAQ